MVGCYIHNTRNFDTFDTCSSYCFAIEIAVQAEIPVLMFTFQLVFQRSVDAAARSLFHNRIWNVVCLSKRLFPELTTSLVDKVFFFYPSMLFDCLSNEAYRINLHIEADLFRSFYLSVGPILHDQHTTFAITTNATG